VVEDAAEAVPERLRQIPAAGWLGRDL